MVMSAELEKPVCSATTEVQLIYNTETVLLCRMSLFTSAQMLCNSVPSSCFKERCFSSLLYGAMLPPPGKSAEDSWRLRYVSGDLFSCPEDEALAHCISEDCRMGAGIAVMFKKKFNGIEELKEQEKMMGQCAVLKRGRRFVYYLITKKKANQKPTYESLRQSLEDMKSHCMMNGVTRISMPRIGCGLDRLKWESVSEMLEQDFKHTDISITVYSLPEKPETTVMKEHLRK